jgi:hypothetical protein
MSIHSEGYIFICSILYIVHFTLIFSSEFMDPSSNLILRFFIPVVFYANEGGWVRQNTTVVGSYLLVWWWLHVSAVLGHLQVITINNIREKTYTQLISGGPVCSAGLDHPKLTVCVFCLILLIVMTWIWPSTVKTCSHHQANKYDPTTVVFWRTHPPSLVI